MAEPIVLGIVGIKNMGVYDANTNYEKLNVVTYQGSTYCALQACKGKIPTNTDYWQLYAQKGETGPQGPKPVKGVDYYTETDKEEIEQDLASDVQDAVHDEVIIQVGNISDGTPLKASTLADMIDTTRLYVLLTDGYVYYYDGTDWLQGWIYQATTNQDQVDELEEAVEEINDTLFYEETTEVQKYNTYSNAKLSGNGKTTADENYSIDRYYPLTKSRYYIEASGDSDYTYQFQNSLNFSLTTLVGSVVSGNIDGFVDVPEGATVLSICRSNNNTSNKVSYITKYNKIDDLEEKVEDINDLVYRKADNIYDGSTVESGGYYDNSGNWVENSVFKMAVCNKKYVHEGDILTYSKNYYYTETSSRFDVFTAGGTWLKSFNSSTSEPIRLTNLNTNDDDLIVKMRIRDTQDETNLVVVTDGIIQDDTYVNLLANTVLPIKNKIINCLGDSFTAPEYAWWSKLSDRLGCVCNNYGVASSRISIDVTTQEVVQSFLNRYSSMDTDADINIIFGGINDASSIKTGAISLGNINSPLDNTTFYGALKLLITSIQSFMPDKKIIGVIPPDFVPNDNYRYLPDVQQACRDVYSYYGIPYADLKKECQEMYENEYNNSVYRKVTQLDQNYHPSELGHNAISEIIQDTLERYIKN